MIKIQHHSVITSIFFCAIAIVISGCNKMTIRTDYDKEVAFKELKSFDWAPEVKDGTTVKYLRNPLYAKRAQDEIQKLLEKKGYQLKSQGDPDFLVFFRIRGDRRSEIGSTEAATIDGERYRTDRVYAYTYIEGSLVINMISPKTSKVIWHGQAEADLNEDILPEEINIKIREAAHKTLAKFPPK